MRGFKILDKYIIRQYLKTFVFTALLFSMISVVIDISDRLDKFLANEVSAHDVIFHYYVHFVAFINGMLWPLFALISVIFFTSRLAKNSEIITIFNAGVPFRRLMIPYFAASTLIFGVHLLARNYLIPMGSKIRVPFENEHIHKNTNNARLRDIHLMLDPNTKLYIRNYRQRDSTALDLRIESYDDQSHLLGFLEAKRAKWKSLPNNWVLTDYMSHTFEGLKEEVLINERGKSLDTTINITPEDLTQIRNQQQSLTSFELRRYLTKQQARGIGGTRVFETELYIRFAEPASIFILTIIGMAVASRKVRGGLGIHLAIGITLGALYVLLSKFTVTFTNSESLGPVLGVWMPNIIFGIVAIILIRFAQK